MTLHEWLEANPNVHHQRYGNGDGQQVFATIAATSNQARWDLFHLADYVVSSSVSGPSYIMVPRKRGVFICDCQGIHERGCPHDGR